MLRDLRRLAAEALATAPQIVLSTSGPAGVQAGTFPCESIGLRLYVLLPRTSDLLFNLESNPVVVATAAGWQARGTASILRPEERPARLAMTSLPDAPWCALVEVRPTRLYLPRSAERETAETIDL